MAFYDAVYLIFVLAATATHGERGNHLLSLAAALVILFGRLQLIADNVIPFEVRDITDSVLFGILFLTAGSIVTFLIDRTVEPLRFQALHDPLTGVANRSLLLDRLDHALHAARRAGSPVAVLLFDLDRFKEINDVHGHHCGDLVLREISGRISRLIRMSDTIARMGGDEFVILLPHTDVAGSIETAQKIQRAVALPTQLETEPLSLGVSIGIAVFPSHGDDAEAILHHADRAMYAAKGSGASHAVFNS